MFVFCIELVIHEIFIFEILLLRTLFRDQDTHEQLHTFDTDGKFQPCQIQLMR